MLGELRIGADSPPIVRGGVVADEMGMGKTLCAASIIAARPRVAGCDCGTLVVAPSTLLQQWLAELEKSWTPDAWTTLAPLVFPAGEVVSERWLTQFRQAGVVLMSYVASAASRFI
jgi:superfamily II DNA or RNA helicase